MSQDKSIKDPVPPISPLAYLFSLPKGQTLTPTDILKGKSDPTGLDSGIGRSNVAPKIPDRYTKSARAGWSAFTPPEDMERQSALQQSGIDMTANTMAGFVTQAAGGFLMAAGATLDVAGIYNMARGNTEKQYGNWLNDKGQELLKYSQSNDPIFKENGDSMWSTGYWANQIQSLGLTGGIIAEAMVEQGLISFIAPGSGSVAALSNKARLLRSLGKQFTFGSIKGVQESYINALETQSSVYQKYLDLGYSDEVAAKKSAEAASLNFKAESLPLMALNGFQFALTFGAGNKVASSYGGRVGLNSGFSGAAETLMDKLLPNITSKALKNTAAFGLNATSESLEEVIQTGVQKYATHETLKTTGDATGKTKFFDDTELRDSAIGGFLGGALFAGVGKALAPLIRGSRAKRMDHLHNTFLNEAPKRAAEAFQTRADAEVAFNLAAEENSKNSTPENSLKLTKAGEALNIAKMNSHMINASNALYLDYVSGKTTAFESHIEQMDSILKAVNANDTQKLTEFGLLKEDGTEKFEGSFDYVKQSFAKDIADSNMLKASLDNNLTNITGDFRSAWDITKNEFQNKVHIEDIADTKSILNTLFTHDTQFNQLSDIGKERFKLTQELEALKSLDEVSSLSTINRERAEEITTSLAEMPNYTLSDREINKTINESMYKVGFTAAASRMELVTNNNKKLADLKDSKKIRKAINERTKQEAAKATSQESLAEIAREAATNGTNNPSIEQTLRDAQQNIQTQLEAQRLAEEELAANEQAEQFMDTPLQPTTNFLGGAEVFTEGVGEMTAALANANMGPADVDDAGMIMQSPMAAPEGGFNEAQKEIFKKKVSGMLEQLGDNPSFEDLVHNAIALTNKSMADNIFNALKEGWELNGKAKEDYAKVYNKMFSNPVMDMFEALGGENVINQEQIAEQVATTVVNEAEELVILEEAQGTPKITANNTLTYVYNDKVTSNELPKLATLFRLSERSRQENEDGTVTVSYEYIEDSVNAGQVIDSRPLLHPDFFLEGQKLSVIVPDNFLDIVVPIFNEDGSKGTPMKFGQYVALKSLTPDSQEYRDKIPMTVHEESKTNEKGLAFIHDVGWYNFEVFDQKEPEKMVKAIAHTRAIREKVIANGTNPTSITITEKKPTTFSPFRTKVIGQTPTGQNMYEFLPYSEADPGVVFALGGTDGKLAENKEKGERIFPDDNNTTRRTASIESGKVYALRRVGWLEGNKLWNVVDVTPQHVSLEVRQTIGSALNIYLNKTNTNTFVRSKHDPVIAQIKTLTGYDLTDTTDIRNYLRQFINVSGSNDPFENADNRDDVSSIANTALHKADGKSVGYVSISQSGSVYIGATKINAFTYNKNGKVVNVQTPYSNSNGVKGQDGVLRFSQDSVNDVFKYLNARYVSNGDQKTTILETFRHNYSKQAAKANKPVVFITADNKVVKQADSYAEYAKKTFNTNIKSINVAKEGETPAYAHSAMMLSYDLTENIKEGSLTPSVESVVAVATVPVVTEKVVIPSNNNDIVAQLEAEAVAEARRLGVDFETRSWDDMASVAAMTEEQRRQFNNLETRIAGLEPEEDFQLNDFIFNQIGILLDAQGTMSKEEIRQGVTDVINNVLNPIKVYRQNLIKKMEQDIIDHPELATRDYGLRILPSHKKEVARIESIQSAETLKVLYATAEDRIAKNLGIKESTIETIAEENLTEEGQEDSGVVKVDALKLDPNARTSAALKRLYSSIPILDKDGNPKRGVFGLPVYYSLEEVGTLAKALLTDTAADFDTMVKKLEAKKNWTWLTQQPSAEYLATLGTNKIAFNLIDKLKASSEQTKAQFVSDMAMNALKMKFVMVIFDRKLKSYRTEMWDANKGGVIDQIMDNWQTDFANSRLILEDTNDEGSLGLNKIKAEALVRQYNDWTGVGVHVIVSNMGSFAQTIKNLGKGKSTVINPVVGSSLYDELTENLREPGSRVRYNYSSSRAYQIIRNKNGSFEVTEFTKTGVSENQVKDYLKEFGIVLHPEALEDLMANGLNHNYNQTDFNAQFEAGGLFRVLNDSLKFAIGMPGEYFYGESGKHPTSEGVVKSLAALQYTYDNSIVPTGGYVNGQNFYPITQNKFATERAVALKEPKSKVREQLQKLSFSKESLWLELLESQKFNENFGVSHVSFNAMEVLGKNLNNDNTLNTLSSLDYEVTSMGGFWYMNQGEIDLKYRDSDIPMRMATMLMPTMSDKTTGLWIKTAILNFTNKHLRADNGELSLGTKKALFEQVVKPELNRILKFHQNGSKTNVKGYDKGAAMFMFMPEMNTIEYKTGVTLISALKDLALQLTPEKIEAAPILMSKIYKVIEDTMQAKAKERKVAWTKDGIITTTKSGATVLNFIDNKYLSKFSGTMEEKADLATLDAVINEAIFLSNSFMLFAGDPAMYFKSSAKRSNFKTDLQFYTQQAKDSFTNVGKRLANQIAPGIKLANSEDEQYLQVFLEDRASIGDKNFMQYVTKLLDKEAISDADYEFMASYADIEVPTKEDEKRLNDIKSTYPKSAGYFSIEASDAQEYTTWQEHLKVLEMMGRNPDVLSSITDKDIADARKLFGSSKTSKDLTEKDKALIGLVMQPIKPVYTGQMFDDKQDLMRTVYIKTSSFPLIPQLTQGFEIDKLREQMEVLQKKSGKSVRASYQSGNKVGAMAAAAKMWDAQGNYVGADLETRALPLDRKNFRIQQDVPFKTGKNKEDKQTMGTQLMKLLFGNNIISYDGFEYQGQKRSGAWLHNEFNELHINLVKLKKDQLHQELGLDNDGRPLDHAKSMQKIQKLLLSEGKDRGFPKQVLDGLVLEGEGDNTQFVLPLWSSINSNKFENLLNAIVTNRVSKVKFPGNSYIAGSPEGFRVQRTSTVELQNFITRQNLKDNTDKVYLFGDNLAQSGLGGQAKEMRGEPNAIGIPTKKKPSMSEDAFMTDSDYDANILAIDKAFNNIPKNKIVVIPTNGLGTGLAKLEEKAPKTFKYLQQKIANLKVAGNDQSQMVYTDSFDGDSLKASYDKDGKVKKVQVFVASKFRDKEGNVINLLSDEWSEVVNGVRKIKADRFDEALFNLTSFRIPTTGISSATQIEIVGFLPHTNGDLMILPGNITKQKGLDFDVDKENTYQYHHILNAQGKLERFGEQHKADSLAEEEEKITSGKELRKLTKNLEEAQGDVAKQKATEELNSFKVTNKLFSFLELGENESYTKEEIEEKGLTKLAAKLDEKLLQNKIIEIYESVLSNPNPEIQAKINGVLNTDFMEEESSFIEEMSATNEEHWTPLSQQYQKQKIQLGASGKLGTGAYAMDVVFHSLAQQANHLGKAMRFTEIIGEGQEQVIEDKTFRFGLLSEGGIESDGELGKVMTLDGGRTTSDVLNEVAQIAVDNEKLQIMGKVNLNGLTLDVHKVFNLLGFDKFKSASGHSISFLFMSQPILKEYVERLSNAQSNLNTTFEPNRNKKIVQELLVKYFPDIEQTVVDRDFMIELSDLMGEKDMISAISSKDPISEHGKLQAAVLLRFMEMEKYGLALRSVQTTLNVESKGLGKSTFDVIQKRQKIDKLGRGNIIKDDAGVAIGEVSNVQNLVGDFKVIAGLKQDEIADLKAKGYYDMGNYLVLPTTYVGAFNVITVNTGYNMWKDVMPYDSPILTSIFDELTNIVQTDPSAITTKSIENKQDILGEFKKYLATKREAGFIGENDDVNLERERLYFDTANNMSLATYLKNLLAFTGNPEDTSELNKEQKLIVDSFIKSNKLFNSFKIEPSKNGGPSLIKFNNTKGESFDEAYLYESLSGLMEVRGRNGVLTLPLTKKEATGEKTYTLDTLAQDLISYAMLGNAKQEAVQFTKYISVPYLTAVGYSYEMQTIHEMLSNKASDDAIANFMSTLGIYPKTKETAHFVSEFTTQYVQHNPEQVKFTINSKEAKLLLPKVVGTENEYILNSDGRPSFIKIYDPFMKGKKKFKLYKFNGNTYNEIPLLGTFGMDEYQFGAAIGTTLLSKEKLAANQLQNALAGKKGTIIALPELKTGESVKNAIASIAAMEGPYKRLAEILAERVGDNSIKISDHIIVDGVPYYSFNGGYNPITKIITINPAILDNPVLLAQTLLHETVHSLTHDKVKDWITTGVDGFAHIKDGAPSYVKELALVFNNLRSSISTQELEAFMLKKKAGTATQEEISKYYGYTSVDEFMTMALTDKGFQEHLNTKKYMGTDKTLLDKFKDIVKSILESLNLGFDENYSAAHAISTIFEVIKAGETQQQNSYESMFDEATSINDYFQEDNWGDTGTDNQNDNFDPETGGIDTGFILSVSPMRFPDTKYIIGNTEC